MEIKQNKISLFKTINTIAQLAFSICMYFGISWLLNIPLSTTAIFLFLGLAIGVIISEYLNAVIVNNLKNLHKWDMEFIKQFVPEDKKKFIDSLFKYSPFDERFLNDCEEKKINDKTC